MKPQISPQHSCHHGTMSTNISKKGPRKRRSLGFPGFPVEGFGFEQLHVVLFEENHIRGTGESCEVGNPGTLGMTRKGQRSTRTRAQRKICGFILR
jgi:hypothetical protein